jgi:hypothetical protein
MAAVLVRPRAERPKYAGPTFELGANGDPRKALPAWLARAIRMALCDNRLTNAATVGQDIATAIFQCPPALRGSGRREGPVTAARHCDKAHHAQLAAISAYQGVSPGGATWRVTLFVILVSTFSFR